MDVMPNLRSALLDLLNATRDDNLRLIIGGGYHALDLYAILAMTNEVEWYRALELREMHRADSYILEATQIAERYFSSLNSDGMLRMRESPYCRPGLQFEEFCRALQELFPPRIQTATR